MCVCTFVDGEALALFALEVFFTPAALVCEKKSDISFVKQYVRNCKGAKEVLIEYRLYSKKIG